MRRIVDVWMALEAALVGAMIAGAIWLGLWLLGFAVFSPSSRRAAQPSEVLNALLGVLVLASVAASTYFAFRAAYKGILYDPRSRTLEIPESNEDRSLLDVITQRFAWKVFLRERIAVDEIEGMSNQRFNPHGSGLNLSGVFGSRTIYFRSKAKRDELRALLTNLRQGIRQDIDVS